jgi:hypothetical protein
MDWFGDSPLTIAMIGGTVTLIVFAVFWAKRTGLWLGLTLACVLLTAALIGVERSIVTEREKLVELLAVMADRIERGDEPGLLLMISDQAPKIEADARRALKAFDVTEANFSGTTVTFNTVVDPPEAIVEFHAMFRAIPQVSVMSGNELSRPYRVVLSFRRDTKEGPWQLFHYELRNPLNNEPELAPY